MNESYEGREQSEAKHLILERYLEKLAYKIGLTRSQLTLNYIDGFAGPWQSSTDDLRDTSPAIALKKLVEVRGNLARDFGRSIEVRAFFVTRTRRGVDQLAKLRPRFPEASIEVVKGTFEGALGDAQRFAAVGRDPFTFIFIDHKGWSGFGLNEMTPLLRMPNNEVLINFMMEHIRRFVDDEGSIYEPSFHALFGDASASYRAEWRGLTRLDREDRIVETYCERVAIAGRYRHCVSGPILMPDADRTYFHLVYGTRSDEGLVTMRQVEREGLTLQRDNRAAVQERERLARSNQPWLLPMPVPASSYVDELHDRYSSKAATLLDAMLRGARAVPWDELLMSALRHPMVSEYDVKMWLKAHQQAGRVELEGLGPRESVPKRGRDHRVRLLAQS